MGLKRNGNFLWEDCSVYCLNYVGRNSEKVVCSVTCSWASKWASFAEMTRWLEAWYGSNWRTVAIEARKYPENVASEVSMVSEKHMEDYGMTNYYPACQITKGLPKGLR